MTQRYAHHCSDSLRDGVELLNSDYNLTTMGGKQQSKMVQYLLYVALYQRLTKNNKLQDGIITVNADIITLVFTCHNIFESEISLFKTTNDLKRLIDIKFF